MKVETQTIIVSHFGNRTIECPVSLLRQLQRERQAHRNAIESMISEEQHNALLAHAERIKQAAGNKIHEASLRQQ